MYILKQDSLTDWLQLLFTITGGIYALYLLRKGNKEKRIKLVSDILDKVFSDKDISTILYSVDQGKDLHEIIYGGKLEREADKTLRWLNHLGFLIKENKLKKADLTHFDYEIRRILTNEAIIDYVSWLEVIGLKLKGLKYLTYLL